MAVLTRDAILEELQSGRLKIDPWAPDQLGAASIDLTLGDQIRVIEPGDAPIDLREDADYRNYTSLRLLAEPYVLESPCQSPDATCR